MRFFVFSNLFIALSAALFTHETYDLLGVTPRSSPLLLLVFSATLLVYNLDRVSDSSSEDDVDASPRHRWIAEHSRLLWLLTAFAAVGVGAALLMLPFAVTLAILPLGLVALGYSVPFLGGADGRRRLKDLAGLKIFLIVIVWAGATALLPAIERLEHPFRPSVLLTVLERGLFIFAITLPFDIRDLERDRAFNIKTIPMFLGVQWTRRLALATIALFAVVSALHYGIAPASPALPLVASAAVTSLLLRHADRHRDEMYYVGKLDGMITTQALLVLAWLHLVQ